jgi:hypothetical protein
MAYLARQAFQEKRRRQCLEITDAILKIEPEHTEARTIQTSVRSELDRDFANAKSILKDAMAQNDRALYEQAAVALRRIVAADPDNLEAQNLLLETVAASFYPSAPAAAPKHKIRRWSILIAAVALAALVAMLAVRNAIGSRVPAPGPGPRVLASSEPPNDPASAAPLISGEISAVSAVSLQPEQSGPIAAIPPTESSDRTSRTSGQPTGRASTPPSAADAVSPATGSLAISSAVPVEIYRGEEYLGSTPATLQLPAGPQTLEYRYQGLRQTLTHVIRSQVTTTAAVSFPIRIQINARPWAQVFVDGVQLTPIGQTPLGDVSVPIGSVLVFQNPGFPEKRYRVTAKDAAIQVTFP